jgi:hypothetical protein
VKYLWLSLAGLMLAAPIAAGQPHPWPAARPAYPAPGQPYLRPQPRPVFSEGDLERHVERVIKGQFGRAVDDIDVDVDNRRGRIKIEAEVRHPAVRSHLVHLLYSMPELAGYQLSFDIEVDD